MTYYSVFEQYADGYEGPITLSFLITNPGANSEAIVAEPYGVKIYDTSDLQYGIDELDSTLYPSLDCRYPCNTCRDTNPDYCLTCLQTPGAPQYLHTIVGTTVQTCVDACPREDGYTPNGTDDPKECVPCHHTCATCAYDDLPGDVDKCTSCSERFPWHWVDELTCHSDYCPDGSYAANVLGQTCATCSDECYFCSGPATCTKCRAGTEAVPSFLQYLYDGRCLDQCPSGYTSIENVCIQCTPPCATCLPG